MSRFHYKKGLLNLVEAWATLRPKGWKVELVGTDSDGYLRVVENRINELGLQNDFIITGALMDEEKWAAYRRADLFVLPSHSENFGIVVAEALWAGVPVITTKGAPWYELEGYTNSKLQTRNSKLKCGWWIDIGVDPLSAALKDAMSLDDTVRREMGKRGQELVKKKYTWDAVAKAMVKGYGKVLGTEGEVS